MKSARLQLTLSKRAHDSLIAFSDASGIAAASFVSQLIENSLDAIDRLTDFYYNEFPSNPKTIKSLLNFMSRLKAESEKQSCDDPDSSSGCIKLAPIDDCSFDCFTVAKGQGKASKSKKQPLAK